LIEVKFHSNSSGKGSTIPLKVSLFSFERGAKEEVASEEEEEVDAISVVDVTISRGIVFVMLINVCCNGFRLEFLGIEFRDLGIKAWKSAEDNPK
jgi:hypothetical protein